VLAWVWAHERPAAEVLLGGGLVMGALLVNEWLGWRSRSGTPRLQTLSPPRP
jgi:drug/metabolite transporter (DMT)-like permease